jgi:DNA-binding LytR/AlgR family response regulator
MKSIEELLPSSRFMRVHRSYIVAMDKISSIDGDGDIMLADELIPVSESYRKNVDDFLADRLFVAKERQSRI